MKTLGILVGVLLLIAGGLLELLAWRELLRHGPTELFDLAAAILLGGLLLGLGAILAFFDSGLEIDDADRVVRHWRGWRGWSERVVEIPFGHITRLSLVRTPSAKFSPGGWRIYAEVPGLAPFPVGHVSHAAEALAAGDALARRLGVRFPAGHTYWTGVRDDVHCDVSLGTTGLTVGEYVDNPHDLNHSLTAPLTEFVADQDQGHSAREIIRRRLGTVTLAEVLEAAELRLRMEREM